MSERPKVNTGDGIFPGEYAVALHITVPPASKFFDDADYSSFSHGYDLEAVLEDAIEKVIKTASTKYPRIVAIQKIEEINRMMEHMDKLEKENKDLREKFDKLDKFLADGVDILFPERD
jgi:hypothetical protein